MADISMDEAKAKYWILEVRNEINAVEGVLLRVSTACSSMVGDDDSIMQGVYKLGTLLEASWMNLCNTFKNAIENIGSAISTLGQKGQEVVNEVEETSAKARRYS